MQKCFVGVWRLRERLREWGGCVTKSDGGLTVLKKLERKQGKLTVVTDMDLRE